MKQKLDILFLCGWYPSKVNPTNGDFIQRHAEAVAGKHKVSVLHIISDENTTEGNIEFKEINGISTYIGYIKKTKNPLLKTYRYFEIFKRIITLIGSFNVVHLNSLFPFGLLALYLKTKRKVPFIISEHWTGYHYPQSQNLRFFERLLSKKIVKNAVFVCPVTKNLGDSMQNLGFKGNYLKVPNVVDTEIFKPKDYINKEFTIVHISSLFDVHKNISDMIMIAKSLENKIGNFTWKFIGGSSDEFKHQINELNFTSAKIDFFNHIPQVELVNHLQTADVFVLFSNYENLPCVILESFSCGVPVISTNVGGINEFFPEEFGKLIQPKNKEELLKYLIHYYSKPKIDKEKMHNYAVDIFSKKAIEKQFSDLYYKSLNTSS